MDGHFYSESPSFLPYFNCYSCHFVLNHQDTCSLQKEGSLKPEEVINTFPPSFTFFSHPVFLLSFFISFFLSLFSFFFLCSLFILYSFFFSRCSASSFSFFLTFFFILSLVLSFLPLLSICNHVLTTLLV